MKCAASLASGLRAAYLLTLVIAAGTATAAPIETVTIDSPDADHVVSGDISQVNITLGSGQGNYTLRVRVIGWGGEETFRTVIPGVSGGWSGSVLVPTGRYGSYDVLAELLLPGQDEPAVSAQTRVVRPVPVPVLNQQQRRDSYIGINTHIGTHWQTLAKFGIHWARHYAFGWLKDGSVAPRSTNGYNFLTIWNDAKTANVTILPCMQQAYWNSSKTNYITDTSYIRTAIERIVRSLPEIEHWELDNEAKYNFMNKGTSAFSYHTRYRDYIHAAYQGIQNAGGGRKIILGGEAGIQLDTYREMLKTSGVNPVVAGEFEAVNYHSYWYGAPPESGTVIIDNITTANDEAHAAGKEGWFTEFGWTEKFSGGVGLPKQTNYMVRVHLLGRWWGVGKAFWFWDRDLDGTSWIATMGVLDIDNVARPLGPAFAALSKFIAFSDAVDCGGNLESDYWYVEFSQPDGSTLLTAWTMKDPYPLDATGAAAVYDMFGNRIPTGIITLTPDPVYILYPQPGTDLLPTVYAGDYQLVYGDGTASLDASVLDDGDEAQLTLTWSKVSGPGSVTFADESVAQTTAMLSVPGTYVLRLTADDGASQTHDDVTIKYELNEPQALHGPTLQLEPQELGGGLIGWTVSIGNDDGLLTYYLLTVAFEGADGATIRQMTYGGSPIHSFMDAQQADGEGDPPYWMLQDSWVFSPFADWPVAGFHPLTGSVFSGPLEGPNCYAISCFSGANSQLGDGVPVAYIVADGNIQWTGTIDREDVIYEVAGTTDLQVTAPQLPGDFNGDGAVSGADYVVWANTFGNDGSPGKEDLRADANGDGVVTGSDYVIWAGAIGTPN